jgi:hypothetical protein
MQRHPSNFSKGGKSMVADLKFVHGEGNSEGKSGSLVVRFLSQRELKFEGVPAPSKEVLHEGFRIYTDDDGIEHGVSFRNLESYIWTPDDDVDDGAGVA